MEFATRKEAVEMFLTQEDWASLNREVAAARTMGNDEAEQFFEEDLKGTIAELKIEPDLVMENLDSESKFLLSA